MNSERSQKGVCKPTQCGTGKSQQIRAETQLVSLSPFTRRMSSYMLICHKLKASLKEMWVLLKNEQVFFFLCLEKGQGKGKKREKEVRNITSLIKDGDLADSLAPCSWEPPLVMGSYHCPKQDQRNSDTPKKLFT